MSSVGERRLFIAGATGAVGRHVVRRAVALGQDIVPHVRPQSAHKQPPESQAAVLDLEDSQALDAALEGCSTIVQLIGTMRKRFSSGDTYETSDIGTTRTLVAGARRQGIEHIVLLSSTGAGRPMGAYLKAKAEAEDLVRQSGAHWTIFRPSSFDGEGHRPPPGLGLFTRAFGLAHLQPISVPVLAEAILRAAQTGQPRDTVLEGQSLWNWVDQGSPSE